MKRNFRSVTLLSAVLLLSILYSLSGVAQVASSDNIYRANRDAFSLPLSTLLQDAQDDLGITISYGRDVEPYLEQKVPMAPWKYWNDPKLRLAYMLAPLDLSFEEEGDGSYRIVVPCYYMRPEEEGRLHLERLLKRFPDRESWAPRREAVRGAIRETMGLTNLPEKKSFNTVAGEQLDGNGFTAQSMALEILPGYYVCGTLYCPTESTEPAPVVLFAHGHEHLGRFATSQQMGSATLARMGAVVFAWSMFAWIEEESPLNLSQHKDHRTEISGPLQTLATTRIIDWLSTLDGVDPSRIAMTGLSGGGTQTFIGTAIDERITVTVPVAMVSSYFFGGCPCESSLPFHQLCGGTNNVEVAACAAPRPMLIIGVTQDWTHNLPEVEFPYLQKIYSYFGKPENIEYAYFDAPHSYSFEMRSVMYPFMAKHLGLDISKADESKIEMLPVEKLLPFGPNRENYPSNGIKTLQDAHKAFEQRHH